MKLTADEIESMLDRKRADGLRSRDALAKLRSTLVQVLDFAVRRDIAPKNPALHATVPSVGKAARIRRSLTPDEARKLFAACESETLGPMFRLGLLVGLRPGELAGLRWADVDLEAGTLTVSHGVQLRRGRPVHVDVLKTSASHRKISLPTPAIDELRRHLRRRSPSGKMTRAMLPKLVFASQRDTVLQPTNVRRELTRICDTAELPRITPNELRHTCATLLNDAGVPLELIADMLGHTTTTMLQRYYRHPVRPAANAAVKTMDVMFATNAHPASSDSRKRMKSAKASADTSRREPSRNDRSSPDRRN